MHVIHGYIIEKYKHTIIVDLNEILKIDVNGET